MAPAGSSRFADIMNAKDFPGGSDGKESACSAGDPDSTLGQGNPLKKGMATPLWLLLPGGFHGQIPLFRLHWVFVVAHHSRARAQ